MKKILCLFTLTFLPACGLVNPGSQGHFAMEGDAHGVRAFVDGYIHDKMYWTQRKLEETEETARNAQPGFLSSLFTSKNQETEK